MRDRAEDVEQSPPKKNDATPRIGVASPISQGNLPAVTRAPPVLLGDAVQLFLVFDNLLQRVVGCACGDRAAIHQ